MCMPYIPYMVLSRYQQAWNHLGIQQAYEWSWHFVPISVIKSFQLQELVGKSGKEVVRKVFFRLFELAVVNSMTIFHDVNPDLGQKYTSNTQRENCPDMEFFLVRIFPHLDWIQSGKNAGKYGPGKTPYLDTFHAVIIDFNRTSFTKWYNLCLTQNRLKIFTLPADRNHCQWMILNWRETLSKMQVRNKEVLCSLLV